MKIAIISDNSFTDYEKFKEIINTELITNNDILSILNYYNEY